MSNTIKLKNISFRVVGVFLRVNQPYTAVKTPKPVPFTFTFDEIEVEQPATVGSVMDAIKKELSAQGYEFEFTNLPSTPPPGKTLLLDKISFGKKGETPFVMNATEISNSIENISQSPTGQPMVAAWQYYIFGKDEFGRDDRIEVSGRSPYSKSLVIRDDMRIIWRLLITYRGGTTEQAMA